MALLDDVKSELAAIDNELPIAKKAQATAMIRFGNGLHSVDHHILVQASFRQFHIYSKLECDCIRIFRRLQFILNSDSSNKFRTSSTNSTKLTVFE